MNELGKYRHVISKPHKIALDSRSSGCLIGNDGSLAKGDNRHINDEGCGRS